MTPHRFVVSQILFTLFVGQSLADEPSLVATIQHADEKNNEIFARKNLVAWCIVPFDGKKRGPAERAEMVKRLGLSRVAYDWRKEHVPTFEREILEYKKRNIEYFAFWSVHEEAFKLFEKHGLTPQIWQTLGSPAGESQEARVAAAAKAMLPLVDRTKKLGSKLGLYNHGGWGGEPENMVAVCKYLHEHHDAKHVGIVYNLHHGHGHIKNFAKLLTSMKPYMLCLNLNGMTIDGDKRGQKILPLGVGEHDVALLKVIHRSGYHGPIGIIGHTQDDVEKRLQDNLDGLDWILPQLLGTPPGAKPTLRTWSPNKSESSVKQSGVVLQSRKEIRQPPLTVECRATLPSKASYNILVASDRKESAAHWEIFSMNGSGIFTAYFPGYTPDHVRSTAMIVDNKPHTLSMTLAADRVQLFVDGKRVADQRIKFNGRSKVPGGLGIGRLVEGGLGCSGSIDWVRISSGLRKIEPKKDVEKDDTTLMLWRRPKPAAK